MRRAANEPKREHMIGVKVTEDEYEAIRVRAFEARKAIGAYVRDLALATVRRAPKK